MASVLAPHLQSRDANTTLRMVAQGHTNGEIAKQRFVSEKAVEQTIAKIAKALDIPAATNQNQRVHIARVFFRLTGQGNM